MADTDSYDPDRYQTERPTEMQTTRVRPRRAGPRAEKNNDDDYDPSISQPMREILNRIKGGESSGRYNIIYGGQTFDPEKGHPRIAVPIKEGPNAGRTSSAAGAYQFIGTTWDRVAEKTGRKDMSKESQDINAVQLAKDTYKEETGRDIEKDWSSGDPQLRKGIERALGTQWESLAAGPRVSNLDIHGRPRLGFGFSDYALKEHEDRPDTAIHWMSPEDYLDLSPPLETKPFQSPSGRSLLKSFNRGDAIESIPTLDVKVDGPTARVTDQDGRHRALLAQQEGVKEIPVAVRGIGDAQPKEIAGMNGGDPRALELPQRQPRQEQPEQPKEPISLLQQAKDAIIPRAEAAEPLPEWMKGAVPAGQPQAANPDWMKGAVPVESPDKKPVAQMSEEEARRANLTDDQQREWMEAQQSKFGIDNEIPAGIARGAGPYAAGAGTGAAVGGAIGGPPGAVVGAGVGAGGVALGELASGIGHLAGYDTPAPHDATNKLLDLAGVKQPEGTPGRMAEQIAAGGANALSGAGGLGLIAKAMRYPASQATANYLLKLGSRVTEALSANPEMQTLSGMSSGAGSQGAAELGLPPAIQWLAGLISGAVPAGGHIAPNIGKIEATQLAKNAIQKGFKLHPADASVAHVGKVNLPAAAAAEAGKTKVNQQASMYNAVVANFLSQEEIGLPRGTTLTPAAFDKAKAPAISVFREVENAVPEVDLARSPEFTKFVQNLGGRTAETERLFPEMAGTPEIRELRDQLLRNQRASTPAVMQKIADLREQATANFHKDGDAAAHRLGAAQRQAAQAMEDAMEDSVKNAPRYFQEKVNEARAMRAEATADFDYLNKSAISDPLSPMGKQLEQARRRVEATNAETKKWEKQLADSQTNNAYYQTLPDKFRQARQLFAKIYDLQAVTNKTTGDVNARGLAKLLERGKPLTGNLKLIADLANTFSKAFQNPKVVGGVESMSVLDTGAAALSAMELLLHGHPIAAALAAMSPVARPLTRDRVLSPSWQNRMIQPRTSPQMPLAPLTTPLLPTQSVPGNALLGTTTQQ